MRKKFGILIDIIAFVLFTFLASTGLLLHFMLPPGSGWSATILGMSRHEWGEIHFWIAVSFFSILMVHLVLHAGYIKKLFAGTEENPHRLRLYLGLTGFVFVIMLALTPLFLKS